MMNFNEIFSYLGEHCKILETMLEDIPIKHPQEKEKFLLVAKKFQATKNLFAELILEENFSAPTDEVLTYIEDKSKKVIGNLGKMTLEIKKNQKAYASKMFSPTEKSQPKYRHRVGYTKGKKTNLLIEFADGSKILRPKAKDSFCEALERIGLERIIDLNIILCSEPLVAKDLSQNSRYAAQQFFCNGHYIFTYTSTEKKKVLLDYISKELGLDLKVSIIQTHA